MDKNNKMTRRMMEQAAAQGQAGMVLSETQKAEVAELAKYFEEDFQPCNDWILVKVQSQKVTEGGIVVPEGVKVKNDPDKAIVVRTGPGLKDEKGELIPMKFKPGDVVYPVFTGMRPAMQFKLGDLTYYVAASECIVGVSRKHNPDDRVKELIHA